MNYKLVQRLALAGVAAGLPFVALGASSAGAASRTRVTFTGSISCTVTGSLTAVPPITLSSVSHTVTLKATLKACTGSTSENGVTITGGHLKATATATFSCTSISSGIGAPTGTISWVAALPGATATRQSFSNAAGSISSTGVISVTLPGSGGTATATGSFAGSTSTAKVIADQTKNTLISDCLGAGVSQLTFTGKHGRSKITVG